MDFPWDDNAIWLVGLCCLSLTRSSPQSGISFFNSGTVGTKVFRTKGNQMQFNFILIMSLTLLPGCGWFVFWGCQEYETRDVVTLMFPIGSQSASCNQPLKTTHFIFLGDISPYFTDCTSTLKFYVPFTTGNQKRWWFWKKVMRITYQGLRQRCLCY